MTEPESKPNADSSPRRITQLVSGAALILMGVVVFMANLDLLDLGQVWRYWPLLLIGVGLNKLTRAADKKNTDEGVWPTASRFLS
jgi:Domain of unknown function (DUF5668)